MGLLLIGLPAIIDISVLLMKTSKEAKLVKIPAKKN